MDQGTASNTALLSLKKMIFEKFLCLKSLTDLHVFYILCSKEQTKLLAFSN